MTVGFFSWLRNTIVSKPPSVLFVLCIAVFSVTVFSFAIHIKNTESVPNPDVFDWNSVLFGLTRMDFCLENRTVPEHDPSAQSSVSISVPISTKLGSTFRSPHPIFARGHVKVPDLARASRRHIGRHENESLTLTFHLLNDQEDVNADEEFMCVTVTGDATLLQHLNMSNGPSACSIDTPPKTVVPFETHSADHLPTGWCKNGTSMIVYYDPQPLWASFISSKDKARIQIHLMVTSVFLFVFALLVVVAAFVGHVCSRPANTKASHDARGDMQLLATES